MRLTAQTINSAPVVLNPEGQLVLQLRGLQIPYIENLGITHDKYGVVDLTNNELVELGNIPGGFVQLDTLLLANNNIALVGDNFPPTNRISTVVLANNNIRRFLRSFHTKFPELKTLVLVGNPVCELANYRLFTIWLIPTLDVLDFHRVKPPERADARRLFGSTYASATALALSYLGHDAQPPALDAVGTDLAPPPPRGHLHTIAHKLSDAEKAALMKRLETALSLEEIDDIEAALQR